MPFTVPKLHSFGLASSTVGWESVEQMPKNLQTKSPLEDLYPDLVEEPVVVLFLDKKFAFMSSQLVPAEEHQIGEGNLSEETVD